MQNPFLEFTKSYFDKIGIPAHIVDIREPISQELDRGLRKTILHQDFSKSTLFEDISKNFSQDHIIYYFEDNYSLRYILLSVPDQEIPLAMVLGPYIVESPGIQKTQEICRKHNIPQGLWPFINQYFSAITYIDNISMLESYVETLAETIYGIGSFRIEYLSQRNPEKESFLDSASSTSNEDTMQQLEYRYNLEEKIMDAIASGDFDKAMHYSADNAFNSVDNRSSNTLRSRKNNLFAFNTVCRKAAERGKVHPIHLDEMSRRMAIKIENMKSPAENKDVHREILKKYCLLVQQQSTAGYSPVMQKILNHISQKLSDPELTLQETAEDLGLNKSYLASLFKKETGSTFTGFVNKKRVERAIFLLNTADYSVHTIASICGMNDMTYFNRIFKKEKGMTPTQYRNMIRGVIL
ncbi:helix-turn-helix domain-containing protein [Oribacterium sp. P6A1]|uniref:helix-turn-helix domain-containing protein n=1 Tax=Oribacterium sp. P6A1 TaxID=1410612 RepID=UPI00068C2467|nr:AraC family transcriptional regulator [Oribacterium sp. P6A1]